MNWIGICTMVLQIRHYLIISFYRSLQFRCIAKQRVDERYWIPLPMDFGFIHHPSNLGLLFIRQLHLQGTPILFEILDLLGPWDGDDIISLCQ